MVSDWFKSFYVSGVQCIGGGGEPNSLYVCPDSKLSQLPGSIIGLPDRGDGSSEFHPCFSVRGRGNIAGRRSICRAVLVRLGMSYRNYPGVGIQSEVAEVRHTQAFALREILGAGPFGNSLALYPGRKKLRHVGVRLHILPSQHDDVGLAASAL